MVFLRGEFGTPPGGWPLLRERALEGRGPAVAVSEVPEAEAAFLEALGASRRGALDRLLFPKPAAEFAEHRRLFGDTSILEDREFIYGLVPGEETTIHLADKRVLLVRLDAISEPNEKGMRKVMLTVNGQVRPMEVRDRSVESVVAAAEKATPGVKGHVAAPFAGAVTVTVAEGDSVSAGDPVAVIEAMKMEATITAPIDGTVSRVVLLQPTKVEGNDLLLVVE